jgi:hypothetical protein
MMSEAVTSPPGELMRSTMAFTFLSATACSNACLMLSTLGIAPPNKPPISMEEITPSRLRCTILSAVGFFADSTVTSLKRFFGCAVEYSAVAVQPKVKLAHELAQVQSQAHHQHEKQQCDQTSRFFSHNAITLSAACELAKPSTSN